MKMPGGHKSLFLVVHQNTAIHMYNIEPGQEFTVTALDDGISVTAPDGKVLTIPDLAAMQLSEDGNHVLHVHLGEIPSTQ